MHTLHGSVDEIFMRRALELAWLGAGHVSPNPLVGCVIVADDRIIGEGWHRKYGEAHAEVNAVEAVADKSLLSKSTLYVTLEPCAHFGKTPPCVDLLIEVNVRRVVVCNTDPNPLVGGKGIEKLRAHGIEVTTGVLEQAGLELNRRFFTFMTKRRPFLIMKWAETADGYIAREDGSSRWISDWLSRQMVHKWRTEEDAILVGTRTAVHDNPQLNVRDWTGRNPVRIFIDKSLRVNARHHLFSQQQPTLCYNTLRDGAAGSTTWIHLRGENFLKEMVDDLYSRKVQSVIVEGGASTLQAFIDNNLWDEARVFISKVSFGSGLPAPKLKGKTVSETEAGPDTLLHLIPH